MDGLPALNVQLLDLAREVESLVKTSLRIGPKKKGRIVLGNPSKGVLGGDFLFTSIYPELNFSGSIVSGHDVVRVCLVQIGDRSGCESVLAIHMNSKPENGRGEPSGRIGEFQSETTLVGLGDKARRIAIFKRKVVKINHEGK